MTVFWTQCVLMKISHFVAPIFDWTRLLCHGPRDLRRALSCFLEGTTWWILETVFPSLFTSWKATAGT